MNNLDQGFLGFVEVMDLVWQGFLNILFSIVCGGSLDTHDISVMISVLIGFILISITKVEIEPRTFQYKAATLSITTPVRRYLLSLILYRQCED
jgi:hypothetical protein